MKGAFKICAWGGRIRFREKLGMIAIILFIEWICYIFAQNIFHATILALTDKVGWSKSEGELIEKWHRGKTNWLLIEYEHPVGNRNSKKFSTREYIRQSDDYDVVNAWKPSAKIDVYVSNAASWYVVLRPEHPWHHDSLAWFWFEILLGVPFLLYGLALPYFGWRAYNELEIELAAEAH